MESPNLTQNLHRSYTEHTHNHYITWFMFSNNSMKFERWTFAQNQIFSYSSELHSHTVLMKLCHCGRYSQLNSILYRNNHIPKWPKKYFMG